MGIFDKKNKQTLVEGAVGLVKNIRTMVDESQLTKEEAVKYNITIANAAAQFAKDTMNENTVRSVTRRLLAVATVIYFFVLTTGLIIMGKYDPKWYETSKDLVIQFRLPEAFIAIIIFFFGGYILKQYTGRDKTK